MICATLLTTKGCHCRGSEFIQASVIFESDRANLPLIGKSKRGRVECKNFDSKSAEQSSSLGRDWNFSGAIRVLDANRATRIISFEMQRAYKAAQYPFSDEPKKPCISIFS